MNFRFSPIIPLYNQRIIKNKIIIKGRRKIKVRKKSLKKLHRRCTKIYRFF